MKLRIPDWFGMEKTLKPLWRAVILGLRAMLITAAS